MRNYEITSAPAEGPTVKLKCVTDATESQLVDLYKSYGTR